MAENDIKIRLSPLSRLYFTLNQELALGEALLCESARYERFVKMFELAESKRDRLLRNLLILDALAILLLFGKTVSVPGTGISLNDIPAAREAATFLAALTFQFLAFAYINWQGYAAIVDAINVHRSRRNGVDPDLLSASDKFLEFAVKLYRAKMNIHGVDFADATRPYKIVSKIIMGLLIVSVLSFLLLHLAVVLVSCRETLLTMNDGLLVYAYLFFVTAANLGGVLLFVTLHITFEFIVPQLASPPATTTPSQQAQTG